MLSGLGSQVSSGEMGTAWTECLGGIGGGSSSTGMAASSAALLAVK